MTASPVSADQGGPLTALTQEPFVDERGEIRNLLDVPFTSAAVITSVKGAVRGNHYHKTDYHYCVFLEKHLSRGDYQRPKRR